MLHLRMMTPADRTDEVVALVERTVGATHLAVLTGAARDPQGDVVLCDVAREAADELLEKLGEAGVRDWGAVSVEEPDLVLSRRADVAEEEAPGDGADAVVWESLVGETHEESSLTVTFLVFLTVATMLAACGVIIDSAILIVGAMAVGPEFGPLAGLCTAVVRRAPRLAWRSLTALLVGFPVAMALTGGFSVLMDWLGLFHEARFLAPRPQTAFIWQPDAFSFIVAFLAGIAGILSLTSAKSGALIGVAISVTTVPAAANAAVALSYGNWSETRGSAVQLALNLLGIIAAGTLTLLAQKWFWARQRERTARQAGS
ncbi:DUF389 domain-containing protein [Streptomyces triculaminicus]|uniref:DUF389 domain-containing protein n=2 Tax=Streptomyces TaxID=1883 RepID=A0A939FLF5_9ACTN|nr:MULTISPECIES: DUF389 domain-containing protein [Streptomyces]MBO0651985.1 DUF389 domain-containing protein [Streptomyces triculaminicus]QSY47108.1 DUF389 domain-containing protein [Streptomyces griseocarneus]